MNAFADWLFSTMFGWMGTAANSAWNAIVNASGGISNFFSEYWLFIVLILIIGGTVMDYAVWFVRWRPYLVWRSWFTRNSRQRKHRRYVNDLEQEDMDDDARSALADWVSTSQDNYPENNQDSYPPFQFDSNLAEPDIFSPLASFSPEQYDNAPYVSQEFSNHHIVGVHDNQGLWPQNHADGVLDHQQPGISQAGWSQGTYVPINEYMPQPGHDQACESSADSGFETPASYEHAYIQQTDLEATPPVSLRSRRSERSKRSTPAKKLLSQLKERLGQSENQETMLDGLPSPVRREDAFHEPIYPQSYHYQDTELRNDNEQINNN